MTLQKVAANRYNKYKHRSAIGHNNQRNLRGIMVNEHIEHAHIIS